MMFIVCLALANQGKVTNFTPSQEIVIMAVQNSMSLNKENARPVSELHNIFGSVLFVMPDGKSFGIFWSKQLQQLFEETIFKHWQIVDDPNWR